MKKLMVIFAFLLLIPLDGKAQMLEEAEIENIALYPQQNQYRNKLDISGMWKFKVDSTEIGEKEAWYNGLKETRSIAVPGSWNSQFDDIRDYLGVAWYEQETYVPSKWEGDKIFLRVGSANYAAKVWVNGNPVGKHYGGHLPFAFEISDLVNWGSANRITIQVENKLEPTRVPAGNLNRQGILAGNYPATTFDFFPYAGLQRAVWLYAVPQTYIKDITVKTDLNGKTGMVNVEVQKEGNSSSGKVNLNGANGHYTADLTFDGDRAKATIKVPDARLWDLKDPYLHQLEVSLNDADTELDAYHLDIGIRTVGVSDKAILLNGKPVFLKGFGKHEDFPVFGRGTAYPVIAKDYYLLDWIGANSYRTSHYPYDEEYMKMADKHGILITNEVPAVSLQFGDGIEAMNARKEMVKQQIRELITRDKNHPSVVIWSLANEPMPTNLSLTAGQKPKASEESKEFFKELVETANSLDDTRLTTYTGVQGGPDEWMEHFDVISINRYYGWYSENGRIEAGKKRLSEELDQLYKEFRKPIMLTEFGTDTYPGMHGVNSEMFGETYQLEFIKAYLDVADSKDFVTGAQIWAFADFKTSQGIIRFKGMNWKGVFTQDRKPKQVALYLHKRWNNK